jgi:glycosyltransferase involved in cell wall biosynthesis
MGPYGKDVGIDVYHVDAETLHRSLLEFCDAARPDIMATQNLWADRAIIFAREAGIPSIYFARTADGRLNISRGGKYECTCVIANSQHVADFVRQAWGREAPVVRSIICLEDYVAHSRKSRVHVTMVNPITLKGGEIFRSIAAALPARPFLAIQGWGHLRTGNSWNEPLLRDLAAGFGYTDVWVPQDVDLSALANVTLWKPIADMGRLYAQTRLLLVPSTSETESIPRVAIEAMSNGIPVIASAIGGISEILSTAITLVQDYRNIDSWVKVIVRLDDAAAYAAAAEASISFANSIDYCGEVSRCISMLNEVSCSYHVHRA